MKKREFYADLKVQTYLCDKMPPKKVKINKWEKWDLANLENIFLF